MEKKGGSRIPKPPVQQRSLASYRQMVDATLRLLEVRDIDQISIREIVSEAGTSYGSFYHRFETKEKFFNYLMDDMLARRESAAMSELADLSIPVEVLPEILARRAMSNFRAHAGLLRSAIRRHIVGDDCWEKVNLMASRIIEKYIERLSNALGRPLKDVEHERIYLAFVWLYGLLSYRTLRLSVVHDLLVSEDAFEDEAIRNFQQLIDRALSADVQ